jgi:4-amino-4-deoxy-L-arabinose transferase-like glycosyltransferase
LPDDGSAPRKKGALNKVYLRTVLFSLVLGLIALLAIWIVKVSTPVGLGLNDDSIAYIAGARGILQGIGYRQIWLVNSLEAITHFPPGYSTALAALGLLGLDPLRGARLLNTLLFGANAVLLGLLGWKMTSSRIAGAIIALLFVSNSTLLGIHIYALSEPLYLFLSLIAFLCLAYWFETGRSAWLIGAGMLVGLAYLTRYAGLALIATFGLALMLLHRTWRHRILSLGVFLASAIPWLLAWTLRNELLGGNTTNRTLDWHPVTAENLQRGVFNFSNFLMPVQTWQKSLLRVPWLFESILLLIGLTLLAWVGYLSFRLLFKSVQTQPPEPLSYLNGLYVFGYLGSLVVSMSLFDASTKFKDRILSPVYVALLILLTALGVWMWRRFKQPGRIVVSLVAIFILGVSAFSTYQSVRYYAQEGQGFASWKWYDSKTMQLIRQFPPDMRIYTNQPGAVYLYTDRKTLVLPTPLDPVNDQPRTDYQRNVDNLRRGVLDGKAALVLFKVDDIENLSNIGNYQDLSTGLPLYQKIENNLIFMQRP